MGEVDEFLTEFTDEFVRVRDQVDDNLIHQSMLFEMFDALVSLLDEHGITTREAVSERMRYQRELKASMGIE